MTRPLLSISLMFGLIVASPTNLKAQTDLQTYLARSLALSSLGSLNADLAVEVYDDRYGQLIYEPTFDGQSATFDLALFGGSVDESRFSDLRIAELKTLFRDRFVSSSILQGPLIYTGIQFSELDGGSSPYTLSLEGDVAITGSFDGAGQATNYAFRADFEVRILASAVSCELTSMDIGRGVQAIDVDPQAPWAIHNEVFLDTYDSPLVKEGYVDVTSLTDVTERMLDLEKESEWLDRVARDRDWNLTMASRMRRSTAVGTATLFEAFPVLSPPTTERTTIKTGIVADKEIAELLSYFHTDPKELKTAPNQVISASESWEPEHIQAHLLRAWYYVYYDELDSRFFDYDIEDASFYPMNRERSLIAFFGHVLQGEHALAQSDIDAYRRHASNPVMDHYMKTFYADQWYEYGVELDRLHSHNESMEALFIGAQFDLKEERMKRLAKKAQKMDEDAVANASLTYVLREMREGADPSLWLDLALAKAGIGQDPSTEISRGEAAANGESPLSYVARSRFAAQNGDKKEADVQMYQGLQKWKKDGALLQLRADLSSNVSTKKRYLTKAVKLSDDTVSTKLFKKGFISHTLAEKDSSGMDAAKQKDLYRDAIFSYKQGVRRGYDATLGNKKIAEAYVALNKPEEAAYYFKRAIENQDRSASVYFAQAVLDFTSADMAAFTENMDKARSMKILESANERERQLFQFLYVLRQMNDLVTLTLNESMATDDGKKLIGQQSTRVNEEIKSLKNLSTDSERVKVYTDFAQATFQSVKQYNERYGEDRKYRKEANVDTEGLNERMIEHSDLELYFFKNNGMIEHVSRWNNIYKEMVKEMPKAKRRSPIQYLQDADVFKDSYNYL